MSSANAFEGIPLPDDGPAPGACVRVERPETGVAVLVLDPPHRKLAVLDLFLMRDLDAALAELGRDVGLKALVVTGREPLSFAAGADLDTLAEIRSPAEAERLARAGQKVFGRIAEMARRQERPVRTVAAAGGPVPGGAYELCLACERIVLAQHPSTRVGLPETQLGILPGWGGSQRLPRRVGVPAALEAILTGRLVDAKRAQRLGLVDRVTHPEYLRRVALDVATGRERLARRERGAWSWLVDRNPLALRVIGKKAREGVLKRTRGHYPAPLAALELVLDAPRTPIEQGLAAEARALGALAAGPVCKNLVSIFRLSEAAKRLGKGPDGAPPRAIERAGVIGAGVMGGPIASLLAEKGVAARLRDLDQEVLDRAVLEHRRRIASLRARRRLEPHRATAAIDRLEATREPLGFARCDLVIEAVAERLEVKRAVLGELARAVAPDAILATNTSSLSVDAIAEGLPRPERVVGMHFFNPVEKMPLVEVVRGSATGDGVVTATAALAVRLGKTPVVVRDVAGFLVNRLLGPYLDEAVRLLEAGVDPVRLERVLVEFGMPMGPLELLDEVGLDIASHAAASLYEAYGERMLPSEALQRMIAEERLGKKTGRGFYAHPAPGARDGKGGKQGKHLADDLFKFVSRDVRGHDFSDQAILDNLMLAMLNEAARALEERVVDGPHELDLATVFGMGFPPFRGGLLRWADSLGAQDVVTRLRRIAESPEALKRPGAIPRFTPAPLLLAMADEGRRFYADGEPAG